jgi:5-methylthioadenosine/S-adenosylhomocysteine deaminase
MGILIRKAACVVRSAARIERDADVWIEGRRIKAVGPDLVPDPRQSADLTVIDAAGKAVIPGLINAHTHLYQSVLRGVHTDLPLEAWLQAVVFPYRRQARLAHPDEAMTVAAARVGCAEMLKNGTTAFIDMDSTASAAWEAWQALGIRGAVAFTVADERMPDDLKLPLPELQRRVKDHLDECRTLARARPTLTFMLAPATPIMCSRQLLEWVAEMAQTHEVPVHGHAAETASELAECRSATGMTPIGWLAQAGVLSPRTSLAHCAHLSAGDIDLLAASSTTPVHCPKSNMRLASGTAPVPAMLAAGIRVALANDGPASNDLQDMFEEMRLAALLHKVQGQPAALAAQDVFKMATEHSAGAAAIDAGTLDPGRLADVVLVDLDRPHLTPMGDVVTTLVYCARGSDVDTVIVDGRVVVDGGQLLLADEAEIVHQARRLGAERYRAMQMAGA